MLLSDVCLSVTHIRPKSRTERPRKTKIGRDVVHVTRNSDTTFKVKVTRPIWLVVLAVRHGHTVMVTYPYAYMTYIVSPLAGLGGGISWQPAAYSLSCLFSYVLLHHQSRGRAPHTTSYHPPARLPPPPVMSVIEIIILSLCVQWPNVLLWLRLIVTMDPCTVAALVDL